MAGGASVTQIQSGFYLIFCFVLFLVSNSRHLLDTMQHIHRYLQLIFWPVFVDEEILLCLKTPKSPCDYAVGEVIRVASFLFFCFFGG